MCGATEEGEIVQNKDKGGGVGYIARGRYCAGCMKGTDIPTGWIEREWQNGSSKEKT